MNGQRKRTVPVSDGLVPFIKSTQLDKTANKILKRFYPEALENSRQVDATVLAKRMGLSIEKRSITKDMSIFGQIYFYKCETKLYDRTTKKEYIS